MNHRSIKIFVLVMSLALAGCPSAGKLNNDDSVDYKSAEQLPPLVIPGQENDNAGSPEKKP